ncbi:3-mercaptopyruvate sulfurtransferase [Desertibaculum subflavum]|uniref:3-mercaptopyruvate sulfurtransferase n=1 Tax=Desertibaculum subflavum TaxID=2268458 RepID=UPI000E676550
MNAFANPDALVTTAWLAERLNAPDVRIVDASWYMPAQKRDPRAEYNAEHIPGAVFFDIDDIAEKPSDLPHMLPSPEKFASRVRKLGLGDGSRIVIYDGSGQMIASARAWWMFRAFGHKDVAILEGGLPKWKREGRPVDDLAPMPRERHFTARLDSTLVRDLEQMQAIVKSGREQVLDARSEGRFRATEAEPRAGLRGGRIPGSQNLPYGALFTADGTLLPAETLKAKFRAAGIDLAKPVAATCGSGVSACVLVFTLHLLGHRQFAVYDGSWTEWGGRSDTPVETG